MHALIFDLDGTLIDTVYAHVFAWQRAFAEAGMAIDGWRIHRRIGMSGGLVHARGRARAGARDHFGGASRRCKSATASCSGEFLPERRPLPGGVELLRSLRARRSATASPPRAAGPEIDASLDALGVGPTTVVIERGDVKRAKPEPDLFLACQTKLGVRADECYVVGDAVWDLLAARRAGMLSVGLLSGGYGEDELPGRRVPRVPRCGRPAPVAGRAWASCPDRAFPEKISQPAMPSFRAQIGK